MDKYVTGTVIRRLRENKKMTQEELAQKIFVSSKAISKWGQGRVYLTFHCWNLWLNT